MMRERIVARLTSDAALLLSYGVGLLVGHETTRRSAPVEPVANPIATLATVRSRAVNRSGREQKGEYAMKKIFTAVVVVVSLALCSVAAAAVSSRLNGTYTTTVQGSTVLGGALNGTWKVKLKNGAYHVSDSGHPIVHGNYTLKGNKISLKDTGGEGKCPGTGVYKFKVSGDKITLTKVHDAAACIGRETVLTSAPLTKTS